MEIIKGESIGGYWFRMELINGNKITNDFSKSYIAPSSNKWRIFPKNYNNQMLTSHKNIDPNKFIRRVVEYNSLAPLFRPTASIELSDSVAESYCYTLNKKNLLSADRFIEGKDTPSMDIKYCPKCFIEQIEKYGHSWFKREWHIFGMNVCSIHQHPLIRPHCSSCTGLGIRNGIFSVLQGTCYKCNTLQPLDKYKLKPNDTLLLSDWLNKLLIECLPKFSDKLISNLLQEACVRAGSRKEIDYRKQSKYLSDLCNLKTNESLLPKTHTSHILDKMLAGGFGTSCYPMLLLWFPLMLAFKSFDEFLDYLKEVSYLTSYEKLVSNSKTLMFSDVLDLKK
ncbi:MAG: TniQ family protein [Halopseudomonas sp.]